MEFNGVQMAAIVKAANAMIAADGRVDEAETQALSRELIGFGVNPTQLVDILKLSNALEPAAMISTLSVLSNDQKKYISGFLAAIMISDGDIDDSEMKLWQLTSTLIGCPTMTLQQALDFWRNN